jgi:hypothetical protein
MQLGRRPWRQIRAAVPGVTGTSAQYPRHVDLVGQDVDWEVLWLLAEATNSTFNRVSEKGLAEVLERFGKYF